MEKKKLIAIVAALAITVMVMGGCGSTEASDSSAAEEASEASASVEASTSTSTGTEETAKTEYANDNYKVLYSSADFEGTEDESTDSMTLSYVNANVETAGSNVLTFTLKTDADAETVLNDQIQASGIEGGEIMQVNIGESGTEAYMWTTGNQTADGSDLTVCETYYAVPCGSNVILIDAFRTIGTDEDAETPIDDAFAAVLDTFALM